MAVALLVAAGSGERLGADRPKAFVVLAGRPMLEWSVEALRAAVDHVVVALPPGEHAPPGTLAAPGGECRSASVRNALDAAPPGDPIVVHDAARPLLTSELVERCLEAVDGVEGAIAAAIVSDTIKEAGEDGLVRATLDRSALWAVQTPQVFRADILRRALERDAAALAAATDDAWLVDDVGGVITVVESFPENLKVTRESDLRIAEALLAD
jgi:2-C-methyl-D-erythritol 4-phosphate cytidylyltransferase